jgi:hypothetical protein
MMIAGLARVNAAQGIAASQPNCELPFTEKLAEGIVSPQFLDSNCR